jgi:hypothetical protein
MTKPIGHHLTITTHDKKQVRGCVAYLQPKAQRWQ